MPRRMRVFCRNSIHHVMMRGVNGHDIFVDQQDYVRFCLLLQAACEKYKLQVHGFCFMTNHIHLAIEPLADEFHSGIHAFSFRYAQYFNHRYSRKGYLFQGRYRSIIVEENVYLKRLIRYIHLNPVESKMVYSPEEYMWSSYNAYMGNAQYVWLKTDRILNKFGNPHEAVDNLKDFTNLKHEAQFDGSLILEAHKKGSFEKEATDEFMPQYEPQFVCKPKNIINFKSPALTDVSRFVCAHFDVEWTDVVSQSKLKPVVNARSTLALVARKTKWWSLEEVGALLNKNSGTMSRLASRAEAADELSLLVGKIKEEWNSQS
jgi:putative transposase